MVGLALLLLCGFTNLSAAGPHPAQHAQAAPPWQQVNSNGFGTRQATEVTALETFNGWLYAATANATDGARIFRSPDGVTWTPVTQPGFGIPHDTIPPAILDLQVFNGRLYASTGRGNAAQIWRSLDGVTWAPMVNSGFHNPDTVDIAVLAVYGSHIYAGAGNSVTGAQVWRSDSGDNNTWEQVAPAQPGTAAASVTGFAVFKGALYAAVASTTPAQVWSTYGGEWTAVVNNGFGDSATTITGGMAVFSGYLYIGAGNGGNGAQLWRTQDGATWEPAITPGLGDAHNRAVELVYVFQNRLYISTRNAQTGVEMWRSGDGTHWVQVNLDGFGDRNNTGSNRGNATAGFMDRLYIGTANATDGGELWRMQQQRICLPAMRR